METKARTGAWVAKLLWVLVGVELLLVLSLPRPRNAPAGGVIVVQLLISGGAVLATLLGAVLSTWLKNVAGSILGGLLSMAAFIPTLVVTIDAARGEREEQAHNAGVQAQLDLIDALHSALRDQGVQRALTLLREHPEARLDDAASLVEELLCRPQLDPPTWALLDLLSARGASREDWDVAAARCSAAALQALVARGVELRHAPVLLSESTSPEVISYLLDRGTAVDARATRGRTPLMSHRTSAITRLLLQRGADPNARDDEGRSPLHHAGPAGVLTDCYRELLRAGANPRATDGQGRSPLESLEQAADTSTPGAKEAAELLRAAAGQWYCQASVSELDAVDVSACATPPITRRGLVGLLLDGKLAQYSVDASTKHFEPTGELYPLTATANQLTLRRIAPNYKLTVAYERKSEDAAWLFHGARLEFLAGNGSLASTSAAELEAWLGKQLGKARALTTGDAAHAKAYALGALVVTLLDVQPGPVIAVNGEGAPD